jgi:hypothetical protein
VGKHANVINAFDENDGAISGDINHSTCIVSESLLNGHFVYGFSRQTLKPYTKCPFSQKARKDVRGGCLPEELSDGIFLQDTPGPSRISSDHGFKYVISP